MVRLNFFKLRVSFLVLFILVLALNLMQVDRLNSLERAVGRTVNTNEYELEQVNVLRGAILEISRLIRDAVMSPSMESKKRAIELIMVERSKYDLSSVELERFMFSKDEKKVFDDIQALKTKVRAFNDKEIDSVLKNSDLTSSSADLASIVPDVKRWKNLIDKLKVMKTQRMLAEYNNSINSVRQFSYIVFFISFIVLVLGCYLVFFIGKEMILISDSEAESLHI